MNILTLDVETTTSNKGNPFDVTNKLVCIGMKWLNNPYPYIKYEEDFNLIQAYINTADVLVGFNIKFDLHWLRRIGIDFSGKRIHDCQIGEFLLESQTNPYPSLNQACEKYGLPTKLDVVKTEYWDKGIDTDQIPREILSEYLEQDLKLTEEVYLRQVPLLQERGLMPLFRLQNLDLLVLQEMEWNGIKFDTTKARAKAEELDHELTNIKAELTSLVGDAPINFNSNDHVSVLLYGGVITVDHRIPVGVYKSGAKVGQTRYKVVEKQYEFPRLVEPLKGTETKYVKIPIEGGAFYEDKEQPTHWKVNSDVLRSLKLNKQAKHIVELLSKYGEIEKLRGTYLIGYDLLITKMNWPKDMIHGNLNQTTVVTGRLSSTKPNLQNPSPVVKLFMESRYGET